MLRLYVDRFWISPYAFSTFVALEEKGVPYELIELGLDRQEHRSEAYQEGSLTGRVPALWHGERGAAEGFWLSESDAINEYLEDLFPPPSHRALFPSDVQERGRARQLCAWVRSDLMPLREERSTHTVFYAPTQTPLSAAGETAAERLLRVADRLIDPERPAQLFASWSIADLDFAMVLQRLVANGHPVPEKVRAFVEAQWRRPSVEKWVHHPRPPFVPY